MGGLLILATALVPFLVLSIYTLPGLALLVPHRRLRRDRLHGRLPQGAQAPLARPLGPLEDARARADHDRRRLGRDAGRLPRHRDLLPDRRRQHRPRLVLLPVPLHRDRGHRERRQPDRRDRRARRRHLRDLAAHVPRDRRDLVDPLRRGRLPQRQLPRRRDLRRGADRRRDRLPLVQRLPGRGVHGRHRLDGARRRDRRPRRDDPDRGAARSSSAAST